jgi:hypothetical protein
MSEIYLGGAGDAYWIMYFFMVVGFAFFYTDVLFAQQNYGENLKRVGAQIPAKPRRPNPTLPDVFCGELPSWQHWPGFDPALDCWQDLPTGQSTVCY